VRSKLMACAALATFAGSAGAQTDMLYVTDGDSARLALVQGGVVQSIKTTHVRAYPIAVRSTVWIGDYNGNQPNAIEYDLAGDPTGNAVSYTPRFAVDGTTDGIQYNYELGDAFGSNGIVYRSDLDFSNPVQLFTTPNMSRSVGITYDPTDSTLWVSGNQEVRHYDLAGNLLGGFNHVAGDGTLAYEPSTDTLWLVRSQMFQYDKSGNLLQTLSPNNLAANNWGAEFAMPIPAPGAAALLGVAGLVGMRRRR
jgi:hypothetical protein